MALVVEDLALLDGWPSWNDELGLFHLDSRLRGFRIVERGMVVQIAQVPPFDA